MSNQTRAADIGLNRIGQGNAGSYASRQHGEPNRPEPQSEPRVDRFAEAIVVAREEATNAKERFRGLQFIGLCEIIHARNPEAEYLVIRAGRTLEPRITALDFDGKKIEQLFKSDESHLEYSGLQFGTIDSVAKFGIEDNDEQGYRYKIPVRSLAGKIPDDVEPEDLLKSEYAKEDEMLRAKLATIPHGLHDGSLFLSMDENLNVKEWGDYSCHSDGVTSLQNPEVAQQFTDAMRDYCLDSTRTSWKWSRSYNIENGWTYRTRAKML